MSSNNFSKSEPNKLHIGGLTALFWLITAVLSFQSMLAVRDIALAIYINFMVDSTTPDIYVEFQSSAMLTWVTIVWAVVMVGYVIGSAEYAFKRMTQRRIWRLFAWAFVVEIILIVIAALL
jgi:hypothetical protein